VTASPIAIDGNGLVTNLSVGFFGGKGSFFTQESFTIFSLIFVLIYGNDPTIPETKQVGGISFTVAVGGTLIIGDTTYLPLEDLPEDREEICKCGKDDITISCLSSKGGICCIRRSLVRELCRKSR